ncbi:GNAT family N-acetyltransferase [Labrenzia sp. 011]|uniref:GNAT family N-acetyltransferase n=1 Tax=Labrenzia sp. 011 TaxID=2171494 RepID=UPI000D507CA4|nr:GNAT family N-acetyltransferase [Labrenzia sp. 011]PVB63444.1 hypothetical protein DCO57_01130 [Labrenzia sp. 011]
MNYRITDCRALGPGELADAMNEAFSDYVTPLQMSEAKFVDFQRQRGFSGRHSFVALNEGKIAAFWFSGQADPTFGNRAYTLSVGTSPDHRRRGLSRRLLQAVVDAQKAEQASGLQLEVITTNDKAVCAYEDFGFFRQRTLRVCKLTKEHLDAAEPGRWTVEDLQLEALPTDEDAYFETRPTPQNARAALVGLRPDIHLIGVREGGELLGWGAAYKDGAVAQIAVHKAHRRRGIGQALLRELCQRTGADQLLFVNVDEEAAGLNAFLDRFGAEDLLRQYEMCLELPALIRLS